MPSSPQTPADPTRQVRILGTHGVPAAYGGFETAAENVGLYLRDRGWDVTVYCQPVGRGPITYDDWKGLHRVHVPVQRNGWLGTSWFDFRSIRHASKHRDICLTFGYNTAVFNVWQRMRAIPNVINMDGIEWSRARWGPVRQTILWTNERIACWVGNVLIADHPVIAEHLATRARDDKIAVITYGAHAVAHAPVAATAELGLEPGGYMTMICRPIPENNVLELVAAFSRRRRNHRLVVLGTLQPANDPYHRAVIAAASDEVSFAGAIYDPNVVSALRFHSSAYLHGHTVGGTNPSLVEAMAAGNPVIAHDNVYNRWVAADGALYFSTVEQAARHIDELLENPEQRQRMSTASRRRHAEEFTWEHVGRQYEEALRRFDPADGRARPRVLATVRDDRRRGSSDLGKVRS